jgi:O-acetyl-ADP-ribose deacetylase (regulator of RNase III)
MGASALESGVQSLAQRWPFQVVDCRCSTTDRFHQSKLQMLPTISVIEGDLLDQDVEVIVNAWNRNIIPWWLLFPQGVSGAIKRRGGTAPFKEVGKHGSIPLGGAVLTSAGKLPFKAIIHVAGINLFWRASEWSIRESVRNAVRLAREKGFKSMAFPLIGAGSGSFNQDHAKTIVLDELSKLDVAMNVKVVVFKR